MFRGLNQKLLWNFLWLRVTARGAIRRFWPLNRFIVAAIHWLGIIVVKIAPAPKFAPQVASKWRIQKKVPWSFFGLQPLVLPLDQLLRFFITVVFKGISEL